MQKAPIKYTSIPASQFGKIGVSGAMQGAGRYGATGLNYTGQSSLAYTPYGSSIPPTMSGRAQENIPYLTGTVGQTPVTGPAAMMSAGYVQQPGYTVSPGFQGAPAGGSASASAGAGPPRTTTTNSSFEQTSVQDPRSQALFSLLEDIIAGNREAVDRNRAFSAASDVNVASRSQQASSLRDQMAVTGGSLQDPSMMAAMRGLQSQNAVANAQAARDISMQADQAKLASQFAAGQMMQAYDPRRQYGTSQQTQQVYDPYAAAQAAPYGYDAYGRPIQPLNTRGTDWVTW
jgi:hypothetical protein